MMTNTNTNTTTNTNANKEEHEQAEFEEEERNSMRAAKRMRAAIEQHHKERADAVAALQRKFAPRVAAAAREAHAAAREAARAARAAAEAARTLQALDAELREAEMAQRNGGATTTAEWPANGIGGVCVAIAERMEARAADAASGAERVAADAERIVAASAGAVAEASASASASADA